MTAYWSWILTFVGASGLYVAGRKSAWGWVIGVGAQVLWLTYAIQTRQWGFVVSVFVYGGVYLRNAVSWFRS